MDTWIIHVIKLGKKYSPKNKIDNQIAKRKTDLNLSDGFAFKPTREMILFNYFKKSKKLICLPFFNYNRKKN